MCTLHGNCAQEGKLAQPLLRIWPYLGNGKCTNTSTTFSLLDRHTWNPEYSHTSQNKQVSLDGIYPQTCTLIFLLSSVLFWLASIPALTLQSTKWSKPTVWDAQPWGAARTHQIPLCMLCWACSSPLHTVHSSRYLYTHPGEHVQVQEQLLQ